MTVLRHTTPEVMSRRQRIELVSRHRTTTLTATTSLARPPTLSPSNAGEPAFRAHYRAPTATVCHQVCEILTPAPTTPIYLTSALTPTAVVHHGVQNPPSAGILSAPSGAALHRNPEPGPSMLRLHSAQLGFQPQVFVHGDLRGKNLRSDGRTKAGPEIVLPLSITHLI